MLRESRRNKAHVCYCKGWSMTVCPGVKGAAQKRGEHSLGLLPGNPMEVEHLCGRRVHISPTADAVPYLSAAGCPRTWIWVCSTSAIHWLLVAP